MTRGEKGAPIGASSKRFIRRIFFFHLNSNTINGPKLIRKMIYA